MQARSRRLLLAHWFVDRLSVFFWFVTLHRFSVKGRVDDVMNVSGHRLGTAEVESALVSHSAVAEAAVVPYPHDIKGEGIYAYVTLKEVRSQHEQS